MSGVLGSLLEGFDEHRHPRGFHGRWIATFEHSVHGRTTSPIEARSSTEAWAKAEVRARESGSVVQSVVPHDEGARAIGRAEDKARSVGVGDRVKVQPEHSYLYLQAHRRNAAGVVTRVRGGTAWVDFPEDPHGRTTAVRVEHLVPTKQPAAPSPAAGPVPSPARPPSGGLGVAKIAAVDKGRRYRAVVDGSKLQFVRQGETVFIYTHTGNMGGYRIERFGGELSPAGIRKFVAENLRRPQAQESAPVGIGLLAEAFNPSPVTPGETPGQSMAIGARETAQARQELASGAFNPSKHPRARGGKFAYTTGGKRARHPRSTHGQRGSYVTTGTSGPLVRSIQTQLGIPADGVYGQQTRAAVMRFQTHHGLRVDGVVGAQTIAALRGNPKAARIAPGPISSRVTRIAGSRSRRAAKPKAPVRMAGGVVI